MEIIITIYLIFGLICFLIDYYIITDEFKIALAWGLFYPLIISFLAICGLGEIVLD
jgi:hypothetical protein